MSQTKVIWVGIRVTSHVAGGGCGVIKRIFNYEAIDGEGAEGAVQAPGPITTIIINHHNHHHDHGHLHYH